MTDALAGSWNGTTFEVQFPYGFSSADRKRLFTVLDGLPFERGRTHLARQPVFVVELLATASGLRYFLTVPINHAATAKRQLHVALSQIGLDPALLPTCKWSSVLELVPGVTVTAPDTMFLAQLLGCFHDLKAREALIVQLVVAGVTPAWQFARAGRPAVLRLAVATPVDADDPHRSTRAGRPNQQAENSRAAELLQRLAGCYRTLGLVPLRYLRPEWTRRVAERSAATFRWPLALSPDSIGVVTGIPVDSPMVPGLVLGRSRRLAPDPAISASGRRLAIATFAGAEQPLTLQPNDRLQHLYVVGPTGSGKTSLLCDLATADIADGYGIVVIDAKGGKDNLFAQVLDRIPSRRMADVVVYDVADAVRPVGFNVLAGDDAVRTTSEMTALLDNLFDFSTNTPRALDVLRASVLTLALAGMTLCEVSPLLEPDQRGQRFRDLVTANLTNPELVTFWSWYNHLRAFEQSDVAAPIQRRLRGLLLFPGLRLSFGQAQSGFSLDEILARGKILLVQLGRGDLGDELSKLVGSVLVTKLWSAIQRRPADARPFWIYADEFQDIARHVPAAVSEVFSQSRGYQVGWTIAHQHVDQLGERLRREVFANARSKVVFGTTHGAKILADELGRPLTSSDVEELGAFEVFLRLHVDHQTRPPVTGRTTPPRPSVGLGQAVRAASRTRYGRIPQQVETELAARRGEAVHGVPSAERQGLSTAFPTPHRDPHLPVGWEVWE